VSKTDLITPIIERLKIPWWVSRLNMLATENSASKASSMPDNSAKPESPKFKKFLTIISLLEHSNLEFILVLIPRVPATTIF